jgi:hypothetical protein
MLSTVVARWRRVVVKIGDTQPGCYIIVGKANDATVEKLVHGFLLRVKEFTSTRNFY